MSVHALIPAIEGLLPFTGVARILALAGGGGDAEAASALKLFLAITGLGALAMVASTDRFARFQRHRTFSAFVGGGWLALVVGVAIGPAGLDLVTVTDLYSVRPLLVIGLGWVGFIVGLQLRRALVAAVPAALWRWVIVDTVAVALVVAIGATLFLRWWLPESTSTAAWLVPPVALLAACAIGWAPETRSLRVELTDRTRRLATLVAAGSGLASIFAIVGHAALAQIAHRGADGVPGFAIDHTLVEFTFVIAVALLLGTSVRLVVHRLERGRPEVLVILLGLISLVAGIAAQNGVSPMLASLVCGAVIANLRGDGIRDLAARFEAAEPVFAMLFFLLAGVLLDPTPPLAMLLLAVIVIAARVLVKPLAARIIARAEGTNVEVRSPLVWASVRQSPVAIAIGVGAVLAESSDFNRSLLTVIAIVGITCSLVPLVSSRRRRRELARDAEPRGDATDGSAEAAA